MKKPSVILLGSKPGSVIVLNRMIELGWNIKAVVVSNNSNYSWIPCQTLEEEAKEKKINVLYDQSEINKNEKVDFVISYMYRRLVTDDVRNLANIAAINFHAGPLPRYGGWAFYNIAILENAKEYGCTCHYMDKNFDTGALLKVNTFEINPKEETAVSLEKKTQNEMIKLFNDFCFLVEQNIELPCIKQNPSEMRYMSYNEFSKLKEIPINADKETIQKYARAFWYPPYECAYITINNNKIEIIPDIVKENVAELLHNNDLTELFETMKRIKN